MSKHYTRKQVRDRLINKSSGIKKKKKSLHDQTVDSLVERLFATGDFDNIGKTTEYKLWKAPIGLAKFGEIDIFYTRVIHGRRYGVAIEVKTNHSQKNYNHARGQLEKDVKFLQEQYGCERIFKIYATRNVNKKYRAATTWVK